MAEIVGGFVLPHVPRMCQAPDAPSVEQREICWNGFQQIVDRMGALDVDTVIVIGDDHYSIFGPQCIPSALIGIGDVSGPIEKWLNTPKVHIENNEEMAFHIARYGHKNGVDWAVSKSLCIDHGTYIPWHFAVRPVPGLKMIPVYVNSGVEPLIDSRRCYQIGQSIAAAVASWEGNERVAIFGTGGIAHWPGTAQMDRLNVEWDKQVISYLQSGNVEALVAMTDEDILEHGGNGGWEIKNWLCMLGALGDAKARLIAYEPVYEWLGSCVYAEMELAA